MDDPVSPEYAQQMKAVAQGLDSIFNGKRKPGETPKIAFALLIAEVGKIDNGRVNHISNADRPAMLREYLARAEGRHAEPPKGGPHG